jgi:hypothetical protein
MVLYSKGASASRRGATINIRAINPTSHSSLGSIILCIAIGGGTGALSGYFAQQSGINSPPPLGGREEGGVRVRCIKPVWSVDTSKATVNTV